MFISPDTFPEAFWFCSFKGDQGLLLYDLRSRLCQFQTNGIVNIGRPRARSCLGRHQPRLSGRPCDEGIRGAMHEAGRRLELTLGFAHVYFVGLEA